MSHVPSPKRKPSHRQLVTAAESYTAAQFALCGFDVLEPAGRANSRYDLGVARADGMMKIAVHVTLNGFWDLADRYLDGAARSSASSEDYHRAIDQWREQHTAQVVCCLVDFDSTPLNQLPRIYLAAPREVAEEMHERVERLANNELGASGLDIVHRQQGCPASWRFSPERITDLMTNADEESKPASVEAKDVEYREKTAAMLSSEIQFAVMN